ncbi:MAG: hypothetical protein M0R73_07775 [Dehalococcoidia bacterium]|nr:hypothetical protein [Dehalococcoidia bacterium]
MNDREQAGEQVRVDDYIEAPPAEVFDYVTDPARRPFGRDDFLTLGEEVAREAPSRVAWEVTVADGVRDRAGTVEVLVRPEGTGTRVRVVHSLTARAALGRSLPLAA